MASHVKPDKIIIHGGRVDAIVAEIFENQQQNICFQIYL